MGRPKGSKNKSTLSKLAKQPTPAAFKTTAPASPKKRGRPAKITISAMPPGLPTGIKPQADTPQKKRGRPSKFAATQARAKTGNAAAKPRRGRPPKNVVTAAKRNNRETRAPVQAAAPVQAQAPTSSFDGVEKILTRVLETQAKEILDITTRISDGITAGVSAVLKTAGVGSQLAKSALVISEAENGWVVEYPAGNKTAKAAFEAEEDTDEACAYAFSRLLEFVSDRAGPRLTTNSFEVVVSVVDHTSKRNSAPARDDDPVSQDDDSQDEAGNTGNQAEDTSGVLPLAASGQASVESQTH